jgi:hypothetical protein
VRPGGRAAAAAAVLLAALIAAGAAFAVWQSREPGREVCAAVAVITAGPPPRPGPAALLRRDFTIVGRRFGCPP